MPNKILDKSTGAVIIKMTPEEKERYDLKIRVSELEKLVENCLSKIEYLESKIGGDVDE